MPLVSMQTSAGEPLNVSTLPLPSGLTDAQGTCIAPKYHGAVTNGKGAMVRLRSACCLEHTRLHDRKEDRAADPKPTSEPAHCLNATMGTHSAN